MVTLILFNFTLCSYTPTPQCPMCLLFAVRAEDLSHFPQFHSYQFICSITIAQSKSVKIVRKPLSLEEKVQIIRMAEKGQNVSVLLVPRVFLLRSVSIAAAFVSVDFCR